MTVVLIDTHAHLDMPHFDRDREKTVRRAAEAGVVAIISVAIDINSSRRAIALADSHPGVFATVGIHPHEAGPVGHKHIETLASLASHRRVVAVGEIGLDFYRNIAPKEAQLKTLSRQLEMAASLELPVIIHSREACRDMLTALGKWISTLPSASAQGRGVIHCFSDDTASARAYLDMGFFVSLGAYIGYPSSRNNYETYRFIPDERLLIETDSPFLPPQTRRSQRNEPAYLPQTLHTLARIRRTSPEALAQITTANARRLFRSICV